MSVPDRKWLTVLTVLVLPWCAPGAPSSTGDEELNALATRQRIVAERMSQLEDRMFRLIDQLKDREPDQARRLEAALREARQRLIRREMDATKESLARDALTESIEHQQAVLTNLQAVLTLLLEGPRELDQRREEMERLEVFRATIRELIEEQRQLKGEIDREARPITSSRPSDPSAESGSEESEPASAGNRSAEWQQRQRDLKQRADELAEQMEGQDQESRAPDDKPSDTPGEGPGSEPMPAQQPTPGSENIRRGSGHMQGAAQRIEQGEPSAATEEQQKAIEQLEEALEDLQETLDQLRQEQYEEILRGLTARFREMLERQKRVNETTVSLDHMGASNWSRSDELNLAGLEFEQRALAGDADKALLILEDDGSTIIFPMTVEQIGTDMRQVADELAARRTGEATQWLQTGIVEALVELIAAMEQEQSELRQGNRGQSGGMNASPPLLPPSAELKMLRSAQVRVRDRTSELDSRNSDENPHSPELREELDRLSGRQSELADIARRMYERIAGE